MKLKCEVFGVWCLMEAFRMPSGPRERTPGIWRYHISRGPIRVMAWDLEEAETMFLMRAGELQQRDD